MRRDDASLLRTVTAAFEITIAWRSLALDWRRIVSPSFQYEVLVGWGDGAVRAAHDVDVSIAFPTIPTTITATSTSDRDTRVQLVLPCRRGTRCVPAESVYLPKK